MLGACIYDCYILLMNSKPLYSEPLCLFAVFTCYFVSYKIAGVLRGEGHGVSNSNKGCWVESKDFWELPTSFSPMGDIVILWPIMCLLIPGQLAAPLQC